MIANQDDGAMSLSQAAEIMAGKEDDSANEDLNNPNDVENDFDEDQEHDNAGPEDELSEEDQEGDEDDKEQENLEEETEGDDEQPSYDNIDEIAEALKLSKDEFLDKYEVDVKIDGVESKVKLSELASGYQREKDYRNKTMQLSDERKNFESERDQKLNVIEQQLGLSARYVESLESQFLKEYEGIDWQKLRSSDPEEYSAKRVDYNEAVTRFNQIKKGLESDWDRVQAQKAFEQTEKDKASLTKEKELLLTAIPEWKDEKVYKSEDEAMAKYLIDEYGFELEDFKQLKRHKLVLLARDAMLNAGKLKELPKKKEIAKKKVKNAKPFLKPSERKNKQAISRSKNNEAYQKFKKSPTVNNAAELMLARSRT